VRLASYEVLAIDPDPVSLVGMWSWTKPSAGAA
jgi:hypothetical protein